MNEPFNLISVEKKPNKISAFSLRDPQKCQRTPRAGCQNSSAAAALSARGSLLCDQNSSAQTVN